MKKKMKSGFKKLIFPLIAFALVLAGCGTTSTGEKVLRVAIEKTFITLSSHGTTTLAEMDIISQFAEGLMGYNEKGEFTPLGAESFEKSEDGLTYTFKLRKDAKWWNGDPVTAHDYVYGWQQLAKDGMYKDNAKMFENGAKIIKGELPLTDLGAEATDDYTLVAKLANPDNSFLNYLSSTGFFPLHQATYEAAGGSQGYGTDETTLMGNGPYKLTEYSAGEKLILERNEHYWDNKNVDIDRVEVSVIPELTTQGVMFESGDLDYIRVQGDLVDKFSDKTKQQTRPENRMLYMYLSNNTPTEAIPLGNENFRKAVAYAFDREVITNSIVKDGARPLYGLFPRGFVEVNGKDHRDITGTYNDNPFNVAEAQAYLAKAKAELGMDTITFKFHVQDMVIYKKVFDNIKSQVETNLPGVTMEIATMPNQIYFPTIMEFNTPAGMGTWGGGTIDYYNFAKLHANGSKYNYGLYDNAKFNELIEAARIEVDATKQAKMYGEAESMLVESASFIPIYQLGQTYQVSDRVSGFTIQPSSPAVKFCYLKLK